MMPASLSLPADNFVLPFQLESSSLRGRMTRVGEVLDVVLEQHAYPDSVAQLLAEAMTVAIVLASSLKYEGVFTLQAKGDSAVRLLVVDVTSEGGVRAYAQFDQERLGSARGVGLLGKGFLAFTCALIGQESRYQGIVELTGTTLAETVQYYFRQSEQVPTGIKAAVTRDEAGHWHGGCLLLQRMPRDGGINVETATPEAEDWTRAMILMDTCSTQELTDSELAVDVLLFRLFHEDGVRIFDPKSLRHQCRCSQSRVESMLRAMPRAEVESMKVENNVIVTCEFCNKSYVFDEAARTALYEKGGAQEKS